MAQYKVPQDVEADDKLIGPFSFRQFVYLLIAAGLVALAVGLFQLFPLLAIIPLPPVLLLLALALPLKKDQPMETYLAAIVSFYLKPRNRLWTPGQRESTIKITAPKIVDDNRTRDITGEEATHRLSFLADIVDTGGYAIKGAGRSPMREDLVAEANATADMFETGHFDSLVDTIARDENERHAEVMKEMRAAIDRNENFGLGSSEPVIKKDFGTDVRPSEVKVDEKPNFASSAVVAPSVSSVSSTSSTPSAAEVLAKAAGTSGSAVRADSAVEKPVEKSGEELGASAEKTPPTPPKASIIELANNADFSVATIAKEANRINRKDEGEVFISLH